MSYNLYYTETLEEREDTEHSRLARRILLTVKKHRPQILVYVINLKKSMDKGECELRRP